MWRYRGSTRSEKPCCSAVLNGSRNLYGESMSGRRLAVGMPGKEGPGGPLLGVECELRIRPEALSSGLDAMSGQDPRLSLRG